MRDGDELLEGSAILHELKGDVGTLLWGAYRDVLLWALTPADERQGLFTPNAHATRLRQLETSRLTPSLELPLLVLTGLLGAPELVDDETVSDACLRLSAWAAEQGANRAALALAQAGALATSQRAEPALQAGLMAARAGLKVVAETWIRRTIGAARRAGDWSAYVAAFAELGWMYAERGADEEARSAFEKARRASRRHGIMEGRARAFHGLLRLAVKTGDYDSARSYAHSAGRTVDRTHPLWPKVMADVAVLWVRQGEHARAVPLLRDLTLRAAAPAEQMQLLALLAHSAAALGKPQAYREAWGDAWGILEREPVAHRAALSAVSELASAAAVAQDSPRVRQANERLRQLEAVQPAAEGQEPQPVAPEPADPAATDEPQPQAQA